MMRFWVLVWFNAIFVAASFAARPETPHQLLWNEHPDQALDLLKKDPSWVNRLDDMQRTPLHVAARFGHGEVVKWLLDHDVDMNAAAYNGFTALHLVDDPKIAKMILEHKPNLSIRCRARNETTLQRAARHSVEPHYEKDRVGGGLPR